MAEKDFNQMLQNSKDMPKIKTITDEKIIARYGGPRMLLAPPLAYDAVMKSVPAGKIVTADQIRDYLARQHGADFTCPLTAGIFIQIVAKASEQRDADPTPYWRTLKTNGELNPKYPGGVEAQARKLEQEGHTIEYKGKKAFVKAYMEQRFPL